MYLIDTSVWIGLFRQQSRPAVSHLQSILEQEIPFAICSIVYQELLQGAKGEADYLQMQDYLNSQRFYHPQHATQSYAEAARIYFDCRSQGITIRSTVDCLIAQIAIEHGLILLHDDADFHHMATVIQNLNTCSA